MNDSIFMLSLANKEDLEKAAALNLLTEKLGLKFEIYSNYGADFLKVTCDEKQIKNVLNRNAGRKIKYSNKTCLEIRERIKEIGADLTASELCMSKQAMYRRLKKRETEDLAYF